MNEQHQVQIENDYIHELDTSEEEEHMEHHIQVDNYGEGWDVSIVVHFSWMQMGEQSKNNYDDTAILLDTRSTFSLVKILKMLLNIMVRQ